MRRGHSGLSAGGGFQQRPYGNRGQIGLYTDDKSRRGFLPRVVSRLDLRAVCDTMMLGRSKIAIILLLGGGLIREIVTCAGEIQFHCVRHGRKHQRENNTQKCKEAVHGNLYNVMDDAMQIF
jgi:hypothetical protein